MGNDNSEQSGVNGFDDMNVDWTASGSQDSTASNYKEANVTFLGVLLGLFLGVFLPPIGWLMAYLLFKKKKNNSDYSGAKSIKVGALVSVGLFVVIGLPVMGILSAIIVPNFARARIQGQTTACKSNLKNIGTALEMYAADHKGHYPPSLDKLEGNYLKFMPSCPSAEKVTYTYEVHSDPEVFTVFCSGKYHEALLIPENYPRFSSIFGLMIHPQQE